MPDPSAVDAAIRERRTRKVERDDDGALDAAVPRAEVEAVLATAGFAPFHHAAPEPRRAEAAEPWRCHVLDAAACRALRARALEAGVGGRVPRLLAAADALALVTWLPEGPFQREPRLAFEGSLRNMEHVAAAGAFVQNALVAATARGVPTYWSSGGWLSRTPGLEAVGAPADELLVGAVFFFPRSPEADALPPGKHHGSRGGLGAWSRWVEAPQI